MISKRIISTLSIAILFIGSFAVFSSCEEDEGNDCAKFAAENKPVNVGPIVTVLNGGVGVDSVLINVTVTYLACGVVENEASGTYSGYTNEDGIYQPVTTNVVLKNKNDRVRFFAIAPELDFDQQDYDEAYRYYDDFTGGGGETVDLEILEKQN